MFGDNIWLLLLWVVVCVVLIVGLAYWFTRYVVGQRGIGALGAASLGRAQIKVLARTAVGKDQNLILVQVEQRYLLLGAAPGGISALAEFSQAEAEGWSKEQEESGNGSQTNFERMFRSVIKKRGQR